MNIKKSVCIIVLGIMVMATTGCASSGRAKQVEPEQPITTKKKITEFRDLPESQQRFMNWLGEIGGNKHLNSRPLSFGW